MLRTGKIGGVGLDVYEEEEWVFLNDMSNSYIRDEELSLLLSMPKCSNNFSPRLFHNWSFK